MGEDQDAQQQQLDNLWLIWTAPTGNAQVDVVQL